MPCHPDRVRRNYDEAPRWRSLAENAAERLTPPHVHRWVYDASFNGYRCYCGAELWPDAGWNVIEGEDHD